MKGVTYTAIGRRSIRNVFNIGIKEAAKFVKSINLSKKYIYANIIFS